MVLRVLRLDRLIVPEHENLGGFVYSLNLVYHESVLTVRKMNHEIRFLRFINRPDGVSRLKRFEIATNQSVLGKLNARSNRL